jgi:chromosome segregation ATPase
MQGTSGGVAELESTVADGAQRRMVEAAREEIASKTAGLDRELISVKSRLWNLERSPPGDGESGDIESGRTRNRPSVLMNLRFAISGLERELREWTSIARRLGDGAVDDAGEEERAIRANIRFLEREITEQKEQHSDLYADLDSLLEQESRLVGQFSRADANEAAGIKARLAKLSVQISQARARVTEFEKGTIGKLQERIALQQADIRSARVDALKRRLELVQSLNLKLAKTQAGISQAAGVLAAVTEALPLGLKTTIYRVGREGDHGSAGETRLIVGDEWLEREGLANSISVVSSTPWEAVVTPSGDVIFN